MTLRALLAGMQHQRTMQVVPLGPLTQLRSLSTTNTSRQPQHELHPLPMTYPNLEADPVDREGASLC